MQIDEHNVNVNLTMLFMEHELDVTLWTIAHLHDQLGDGVTLSVLHNGQGLADVGNQINALPNVSFYEAGTNLGVAGGRNFLLRTDECRAADVVMFVDNDVLPPVDYVERAVRFLLSRHDAGVVGASVLVFRHFEEHLKALPARPGVLNQRVYELKNPDIHGILRASPSRAWFDHLGIHPDWNAAYLEAEDEIDKICQSLNIADSFKDSGDRFYALRKNDPAIREALIAGELPWISVSNIAGCCQTFRRSLVDEIGELCDAFNPYGFEDVDFCIRAMRAGYTNYTDTTGFLLHGTDTRHRDRRRLTQASRQERNRTRGLTILAYRHAPASYEELMKKRILARCMAMNARGLPFKELLHAQLVGFGIGQRQINAGVVSPVELSHVGT